MVRTGLCAGVLWSIACSGPPPPFKPVVDTKLLMQATIDPTADQIWDAVKTVITQDGMEDIRPRTSEQWTAVRNHAVTLAESGNLLMMVPRAKDGGEWMARSQELIESSERAIRAAEAKDADQLFSAGGDIYNACSNCHGKYMDAIVNANK
jgi:hypothetical protein